MAMNVDLKHTTASRKAPTRHRKMPAESLLSGLLSRTTMPYNENDNDRTNQTDGVTLWLGSRGRRGLVSAPADSVRGNTLCAFGAERVQSAKALPNELALITRQVDPGFACKLEYSLMNSSNTRSNDKERAPTNRSSFVDDPWKLTAFLFLLAGAAGIPLIWSSRGLTLNGKIILTILVSIYTLVLLAILGWFLVWAFHRLTILLSQTLM